MPFRPTTTVPGIHRSAPITVELEKGLLPLRDVERYTLRYGIG